MSQISEGRVTETAPRCFQIREGVIYMRDGNLPGCLSLAKPLETTLPRAEIMVILAVSPKPYF